MNRLNDPAFRFLPPGEIRPGGWLLRQLMIQAEGLSGNLDRFWPDIKDSGWLGGSAEAWERLPYWLDGFVPLAWLLDDGEMKGRAHSYVERIIDSQRSDGWICPSGENRGRYDLWALFLILKVLVQYHDMTSDGRVEGVVEGALRCLDRHIDRSNLFAWGQSRWFEALLPIWWLYERTGEDWLPDLAVKLRAQGFNWLSLFDRWPYREPDVRGRWSHMSHVVNNAMMLKSGPLLWRMTGRDADLGGAGAMVSLLDRYHGMVTGVFTGDECLAGTSPVQGTELCAVAEYMYSLEHVLALTGEARWGDRLERVAYNALPATFGPDMWTHQYDQQVNQIECSRQKRPVFRTNGGDANLFGIEPNYGCCTANLSQAWPKLALSTFMAAGDGLVAAAYAPGTVTTEIGGTAVQVTLDTGYPFREDLEFTVRSDGTTRFALWLRIPAWARDAGPVLDGRGIGVGAGGFHRLERRWPKESSFTLHLPMRARIEPRPRNLYALTRGPLVYALPLGECWEPLEGEDRGYEAPVPDFEVYPTTPWNYGLCLDDGCPEPDLEFVEQPVGDQPFSPGGAPVETRVGGRRVDWERRHGAAAPAPRLGWVADEVEELRLIPYGCTNLRMTEMPLV